MENIVKSINLKKELDSLRPLKNEDELRIMQKFRLDWNYHSNNLEGNTLTYGETKALILFGITAQAKPLKDHFEITGHNEALKWVIEVVKQERPFTENFIRELHTLILKESYKVPGITPDGQPTTKQVKIGEYKTTPNHVLTQTGEIFRFASPEETPAKMHDLMNWYQEQIQEDDLNPVLLAAEFHYKFIRIHPFDDGNGRIARILMNFILMQFQYAPVIIKTNDKANYFLALRQADAGHLEPFIDYIAKNLNDSLEIMIKGAKGESIEDPNDLDKEIELLKQKIKTIGQPVEHLKSEKVLRELYNNSILKLIQIFLEEGKKFEAFYLKHKFRLYVENRNGSIEPFLFSRFSKSIIEYNYSREAFEFSQDTKALRLDYGYHDFNDVNFYSFFHYSIIYFQFDATKYKVETLSGLVYEKHYGEQLTDNEIMELVKSETSKHTKVIEGKIEEIKNSKS
jgi:Fic family protein